MSSRVLGAGILIGISALFISCDSGRKAVDPVRMPLPAAGRNELYVSGEDRLTINEFERLRGEYPTLSPDTVALLALDAQHLARSWKGREGGTALGDAARCVRALLDPKVSEPGRKEAESLLKTAFGRESLSALETELSGVRRSRGVDWNPGLVRELGLSAR
jgi:hypothetical protein